MNPSHASSPSAGPGSAVLVACRRLEPGPSFLSCVSTQPAGPSSWAASLLAVVAAFLPVDVYGVVLLALLALLPVLLPRSRADPSTRQPLGRAVARRRPGHGGRCTDSSGISRRSAWQQISIFLSPMDVHVNRMPVGGRVVKVEYHPGRFLPAYRDEAADLNEYTEVVDRSRRAA